MGHKVNPMGLRLGINRTWDSCWFAENNYAQLLKEDVEIRDFLKKRLKAAGIAKVVIERPAKKCRVFIHTARPGIIIGKKGADLDGLKKELQKLTSSEVFVNIVEVRKADADAQLIAENIANQLERRIAFRRAMKRALQNAMMNGVEGIRINVSGRLGGAEIARREWSLEGRLPLHTFRNDINVGFSEAVTTYGQIGVKVWVNHGLKHGIGSNTGGEAPASKS
jgi:small subunit ribosomal protein S3